MIEQVVKIVGNPKIERTKGSAGYKTQVYGAATVSNLANATGGIKAENLVKPSM